MGTPLVVTTHMNAEPGKLFPQWLDADSLQQWWWPEIDDTAYAVDGREGGEYSILSDERGMGVQGRFVGVDEPRRLQLSWVWIDHGVPGDEEQVVVDFNEEDGGTRVTVTHDVANPDNTDSYRQGWDYVLGNLAYRYAG